MLCSLLPISDMLQETQLLPDGQVDKQELVQRLWIPFRDLRQLDPMVRISLFFSSGSSQSLLLSSKNCSELHPQVPIPYPSSIFIRYALCCNARGRPLLCRVQSGHTSNALQGEGTRCEPGERANDHRKR